MNTPLLQVEGLHYSISNTEILKNVNLSLEKGRIASLVGSSGAGKSTLLSILSGYTKYDAGKLQLSGKPIRTAIDSLIPGELRIGYLPQHFELIDEADVFTNVSYEARRRWLEIDKEYIAHLLENIGLAGYETRSIKSLSGGEKQRIAIIRAIAHEPELLVLDEPFSQIDATRSFSIIQWLKKEVKETGMGVLLASHEPRLALYAAEECYAIMNGKIVQSASPHSIYHRPVNKEVAGLFGPYNSMSKQLKTRLSIPLELNFIRPERLRIDDAGVSATVSAVHFIGQGYWLSVLVGEEGLLVFHEQAMATGEVVKINYNKP